jgi:hypothetical protein
MPAVYRYAGQTSPAENRRKDKGKACCKINAPEVKLSAGEEVQRARLCLNSYALMLPIPLSAGQVAVQLHSSHCYHQCVVTT